MPIELNIIPRRQRKYRFALTPLADAMFQLLIFFMLTSNLTAYSLLPIQTAAEVPKTTPDALPALGSPSGTEPAETVANPAAIWTIEAENLVVGGERFAFDRLPILANAVLANDVEAEVILIVHPSAHVQDLATVLAGLKAAGIAHVRLGQDS